MGEIQWGLADPNAFQRGYQQTSSIFDDMQKKRLQAEQDAALRQFAANPNAPDAINALARYDPKLAVQYGQDQAKQQQTKHEQDTKIIGALARDAKDPQSFDAAVDQVIQMGYPEAAQFKGKFSPGLRSALMAAGGIKDETANQPNIAKEVDYYRSLGRDDLAQQLLQHHAEGPPVMVENGDGTKTLYPRAMLGQTATAPTTQGGGPQPGAIEDGYRFKGGDPARAKNWEPVNGGQTPQASGVFQP